MSNHKARVARLEARHMARPMTWREFIECDDIAALPDPEAWRAFVADRIAPIVPEAPGAGAPGLPSCVSDKLSTAEQDVTGGQGGEQ